MTLSAAPPPVPQEAPAPIHVLVADDEPALRRSLARILESRGMRVGVVEDGLQALDYVAKTPPDVALVDVMMPGLGGLDVLSRLKASGAPCEVILMTAFVDVESAVAAMRAGAYNFLTKPFHSNDAVAHAVEKAAEHRRLADRAQRLEAMLADLARLPYTEAKRRLLSLFDETYTAEVLRGASGNMSEAARRAGLDRSNFRRLLKRHGSPARDEASPARDEASPARDEASPARDEKDDP